MNFVHVANTEISDIAKLRQRSYFKAIALLKCSKELPIATVPKTPGNPYPKRYYTLCLKRSQCR